MWKLIDNWLSFSTLHFRKLHHVIKHFAPCINFCIQIKSNIKYLSGVASMIALLVWQGAENFLVLWGIFQVTMLEIDSAHCCVLNATFEVEFGIFHKLFGDTIYQLPSRQTMPKTSINSMLLNFTNLDLQASKYGR